MGYLFSIAAGLIGGVAAVLLIERRRSNKRRRARSRAANAAGDEKRTAGQIENGPRGGGYIPILPGSGWAFGL